jgi:methionyl-tRNA formyltransferase
LAECAPEADLAVVTFREEPWEPPFLAYTKKAALEVGAGFTEFDRRDPKRWEETEGLADADLLLAVNWRYFFPRSVYEPPSLGAYIFHDALLPHYRGFSPVVWAMMNGEKETGVSLIACDQEIDAGGMVDQVAVPIGEEESIAQVTEKVTGAYLDVLERNLPSLLAGKADLADQDHSQATYTCKLVPADAQIDWTLSTETIHNLIRAYSQPYPGAYTFLNGERLTIWAATHVDLNRRYTGRVPGRVVQVREDEGTIVLTGDGALLVTDVQAEGPKPTNATEIIRGLSMTLGNP